MSLGADANSRSEIGRRRERRRARRPRAAGLWGESGRYLIASLVALTVDCGVYALLLAADILAITAGVLGYCCGLLVHYVLSARWVFNHRTAAAPGSWLRLAKFATTGLVGLTLTAVIIGLLTRSALCGDYLAKLVAVAVAYLAVFALRRGYVFGPSGLRASR